MSYSTQIYPSISSQAGSVPGFFVYLSTDVIYTGGITLFNVPFNTILYDPSGQYSTSNYNFITSVAGMYVISFQIAFSITNATITNPFTIEITSSPTSINLAQFNVTSGQINSYSYSALSYLPSGVTVKASLVSSLSVTSYTLYGYDTSTYGCYFSCKLLS